MSIQNVQPVSNCPKCRKQGLVIEKNNKLLDMLCQDDECNFEWKTHSLECKDCGEPSGYVVPGPCMKCYKEKYASA